MLDLQGQCSYLGRNPFFYNHNLVFPADDAILLTIIALVGFSFRAQARIEPGARRSIFARHFT